MVLHFSPDESTLSLWFILTLVAAIFLGLYDVAKKHSVNENAVPPVLLANVSTAALIWSVPVIVGLGFVESSQFWPNQLWQPTINQHGLLFAKSAMVGSSWMFAFFALKALPISIAAPLRATSPLWTILLAVTLTGERPALLQWLGIGLILTAFFSFSFVGKREGIRFHRDPAIGLLVVATLISSFCGLYDKYLLQTLGLKPAIVQAWFSIYLVPVMLPLNLYWWRFDRIKKPFQWRWSIPLIAIFLLVADYTYFVAVSQPDALISVISPLRRTSIVIAFLFGIIFLKEQNWRSKLISIVVLIAGMFLIALS